MIFLSLLFFAALFISSVAAYFSISGLTAIFPSIIFPIVAMGIALDFGKLVAASFVFQYWDRYKIFTRTIFLGMTITLSAITSVGVYGYLARAHIEGTSEIVTSEAEVSAVQKQIDAEQSNLVFLQQSLQQTLAQGDRVVNNYLSDTVNTRTTTQTVRAEASRRRLLAERQTTRTEIAAANTHLLGLQQKKDSLSQNFRVKEVNIGPLKYLGTLISSEADTVAIYFILTLTFVLDPLALLLVVAANIHRREMSLIRKHNPPMSLKNHNPPMKDHVSAPLTSETRESSFFSDDNVPLDIVSPAPSLFDAEAPAERRSPPRTDYDFRLPEKWAPQDP